MAASSTKNKKKTAGKSLGVKKFNGNKVYPNDVIVKQRGIKWKPGLNTTLARDHGIVSKIEGIIKFTKQFVVDNQSGNERKITMVHVLPSAHSNLTKDYFKPYVYHPEQFPELAQYNPEPYQFDLTRKPKPKKVNPYMPKKATISGMNLIIPEDIQQRLDQQYKEQKEFQNQDIYIQYEKNRKERLQKLDSFIQNIESSQLYQNKNQLISNAQCYPLSLKKFSR